MLRNWMMVVLSMTLLTTTMEGGTNRHPHLTGQLVENNSVELEGLDENGFYYKNPKLKELEENYNKTKIEKEERERRLKEEELKRQQEEQNKQRGIPIRLLVTYYGSTASQCGNSEGIMANQEKAHYGAIACPSSIPLGSKIIMDESGREFICKDRGNPKYICELGENYYRVDIYIPRLESEINNDHAYEQRVLAMGKDDVTAMLYPAE